MENSAIRSVIGWAGFHKTYYQQRVNLLGDSINIIKQNIETHLEASRDIGLEKMQKRKHMIMSHHQNSGQPEYNDG
jgi:hypothetical protein